MDTAFGVTVVVVVFSLSFTTLPPTCSGNQHPPVHRDDDDRGLGYDEDRNEGGHFRQQRRLHVGIEEIRGSCGFLVCENDDDDDNEEEDINKVSKLSSSATIVDNNACNDAIVIIIVERSPT